MKVGRLIKFLMHVHNMLSLTLEGVQLHCFNHVALGYVAVYGNEQFH